MTNTYRVTKKNKQIRKKDMKYLRMMMTKNVKILTTSTITKDACVAI